MDDHGFCRLVRAYPHMKRANEIPTGVHPEDPPVHTPLHTPVRPPVQQPSAESPQTIMVYPQQTENVGDRLDRVGREMQSLKEMISNLALGQSMLGLQQGAAGRIPLLTQATSSSDIGACCFWTEDNIWLTRLLLIVGIIVLIIVGFAVIFAMVLAGVKTSK